MGVLRVMGSQGGMSAKWSQARARSGDPVARAAVAEAERIFEEARARGAAAFRVEVRRHVERVDRFDPEAEQIVLIPHVMGG